ncbi:polymer-forming cytoskeletal protein [Paenibacillus vini]|uniref:Polymer-forming cytoskeletal protein n=1 Tax=Paenibacillus vini TaxID=1476024 RepID=A0ABQ4MKW1_9BACL|nr:polymer-forming cytoskeletal protein [Paenibacillus vini]GIP56080.1 hypothetical protein J42TS3_51150 [Paenibacillus vini]
MNQQNNPNMTRHNLRLVGESSSNGGFFDEVRVTGDAEFNGDVDCQSFKCTGNSAVDGSLSADLLKITGNLGVEGNLNVGNMHLTGELKVNGHITGGKVQLFGECAANGEIRAEQFLIKGVVQAEGMLNAEQVEIRMLGSSRTREIVGTHIEVKPYEPGKWMPWLWHGSKKELEASIIEGDVIRLRNVTADVVRGGDVEIGPGCRIRLVEYSEALRQDEQSEVGQSVKRTVE